MRLPLAFAITAAPFLAAFALQACSDSHSPPAEDCYGAACVDAYEAGSHTETIVSGGKDAVAEILPDAAPIDAALPTVCHGYPSNVAIVEGSSDDAIYAGKFIAGGPI